jgi:hypothetical protein
LADVFISYKREERPRCERIAAKLRALGLDVWFDANLESGSSFDREIERTLAKAKAVLVLWSSKSVDSQWVRNEAGVGKEAEKLVAASLEPCKLPVSLAHVHHEALHNPEFQDDDPAWLKIVERIAKLTNRPSIVSFSLALAKASAPLEQWARENAADPLAQRMRQKANILGGADAAPATPAPKAKPMMGALVTTGVAALALGAGAGTFALAPLLQPGMAIGDVETIAAPSAESVALTLVGRYRTQSDANCAAPAQPVEVWLGQGVLRVSTSAEEIREFDGEWLKTMPAGGSEPYAYKREGDNLLMRIGSETFTFVACPNGAVAEGGAPATPEGTTP